MKYILLPLLSSLIMLVPACKKVDTSEKVPFCIKTKIRRILNKPVQNPAAQVWEWKDDSNTYYYITSGCCDQYNYLYNDKCKKVCALDGGFTGGGDGKCPNYDGTVVKTKIWEDTRD